MLLATTFEIIHPSDRLQKFTFASQFELMPLFFCIISRPPELYFS